MIKQSLLLKWVIAILLGLGGATAMAFYINPTASIFQYPKSIFEEYLKPKAPKITYAGVVSGCGARIRWGDVELNEDGVRFSRRTVGQPNFVVIETTGPHSHTGGIFHDYSPDGLPVGTYEYRVSLFNGYGETFSNISDPVAIVSATCDGPISPVMNYQQVVDGCDVQIWFFDYSEDEDGLRVYRRSYVANVIDETLIAELGPHAGVPGGYKDQGLPTGYFKYSISAFNENGETFYGFTSSNYITEEMCDKANSFQPTPFQSGNPLLVVTPMATLVSTITPSPVPQAQACIWKAAVNVFVRSGPGASLYPEITAIVAGTELPVIGQSEDGQFWAVELQPRVVGYVPKAEKFGAATGDCNGAPTLQDPVPPPSPVPTVTPQCSDGIDNDGDGWIDGLDRQCTGPNDTSE